MPYSSCTPGIVRDWLFRDLRQWSESQIVKDRQCIATIPPWNGYICVYRRPQSKKDRAKKSGVSNRLLIGVQCGRTNCYSNYVLSTRPDDLPTFLHQQNPYMVIIGSPWLETITMLPLMSGNVAWFNLPFACYSTSDAICTQFITVFPNICTNEPLSIRKYRRQ